MKRRPFGPGVHRERLQTPSDTVLPTTLQELLDDTTLALEELHTYEETWPHEAVGTILNHGQVPIDHVRRVYFHKPQFYYWTPDRTYCHLFRKRASQDRTEGADSETVNVL